MKIADLQFKTRYNSMWSIDDGCEFYSYNIPESMILVPGDYVVVETRYGLSLAVVVQVRDEKDPINVSTKIVTKINGYNLVDEENRKKRKEELERKIKDLEIKLKDREKYNLIMSVFPESKEIIEEYLSL